MTGDDVDVAYWIIGRTMSDPRKYVTIQELHNELNDSFTSDAVWDAVGLCFNLTMRRRLIDGVGCFVIEVAP